MKKLALILLATLCLASCEKDDSKWIDGTHWEYNYTNSESYKKQCTLTLKIGGGMHIYDGFPPSYGYAYDEYEYSVTSYTYDGDKKGTIKLRGINYYAEDSATATFTLNYNNEKMSISTPNGSYTMERTQ